MSVSSVCSLKDLTEGACHRVEYGGVAIALFLLGDEVHALADRCSHAEASLSKGEVFGSQVECPLHGAAFDISSGRALTLPATEPVMAYQTEVCDGEIFIVEGEGGDDA